MGPHIQNERTQRAPTTESRLVVRSMRRQRLRVEYGGRKRKGTSIEHVKDSGGSAIREPLQQLEKAGLVAKEGAKGRKLSGEGVSLLNKVSGDLLKGSSSGEGSKQ
jgi:ribosomal protein S19E (S16A)